MATIPMGNALRDTVYSQNVLGKKNLPNQTLTWISEGTHPAERRCKKGTRCD